MTGSRDIFTKINDLKDRDKVFYDLAAAKTEIVGKVHGTSSDTYILKAKFYTEHELECEVIGGTHSLPKTGEMIMQITLGAEKYLCSSPFHLRQDRVYMKTNVDLFHLQRREDFRLRLPMSYKAHLLIQNVNGKPVSEKRALIDLSGGGCKISNDRNLFPLVSNDLIAGELEFPDRPAVSVRGVIRHAGEDKLGIEFSGISAPAKNKIVALVMDLYRELFSRLTIK
jgi:hypothetical protein